MFLKFFKLGIFATKIHFYLENNSCIMRKVWCHQIWIQNYLGFIVSDQGQLQEWTEHSHTDLPKSETSRYIKKSF